MGKIHSLTLNCVTVHSQHSQLRVSNILIYVNVLEVTGQILPSSKFLHILGSTTA